MIIDEMSIKKFLEWDGKYYHGCADFGGEVNNDSLKIAKGALTFMHVGINTNWKYRLDIFYRWN